MNMNITNLNNYLIQRFSADFPNHTFEIINDGENKIMIVDSIKRLKLNSDFPLALKALRMHFNTDVEVYNELYGVINEAIKDELK